MGFILKAWRPWNGPLVTIRGQDQGEVAPDIFATRYLFPDDLEIFSFFRAHRGDNWYQERMEVENRALVSAGYAPDWTTLAPEMA